MRCSRNINVLQKICNQKVKLDAFRSFLALPSQASSLYLKCSNYSIVPVNSHAQKLYLSDSFSIFSSKRTFSTSNSSSIDAKGDQSNIDTSSAEQVSWTPESLDFEYKNVYWATNSKITKLSKKITAITSRNNDSKDIITDSSNKTCNPKLSNESDESLNNLESEMKLLKSKLNELSSFWKIVKKSTGITPEIVESARIVGLKPPSLDLIQSLSKSIDSKKKVDKKPSESKSANTPKSRKPYLTFTSSEDIEIFVGRTAEDNDVLSTSSEYRDPREWWLHVAGAPGSHVVIKCTDNEVESKFKKTLYEAALLTAHFSKAKNANSIEVHYTRCRNVKKPPGSKPGLVQLSGYSGFIRVNLGVDKKKLEAILSTKTL